MVIVVERIKEIAVYSIVVACLDLFNNRFFSLGLYTVACIFWFDVDFSQTRDNLAKVLQMAVQQQKELLLDLLHRGSQYLPPVIQHDQVRSKKGFGSFALARHCFYPAGEGRGRAKLVKHNGILIFLHLV